MTYDIICLLLVILAFVGGFQKGVVRIFSFLIAIIFAAILTIWSAPYVLHFMLASHSNLPSYASSIIFALIFLLSCWLLSSLVSVLWKPLPNRKQSPAQNIAGGIILSAIMLLSIAILSGFFEQTKVITPRTKESSIAYKILTPIHEGSRQLWINLTINTKEMKQHAKGVES